MCLTLEQNHIGTKLLILIILSDAIVSISASITSDVKVT